jgi:hypothetical protein
MQPGTKVEIYEVNYSVSPGGVDCWEMTVESPGYKAHFGNFDNPSEALEYAMKHYPTRELSVSIKSLEWYEYREAKEANA